MLVSSPVAKFAYKQHRYRNNCIATGSIYAWALSIGGVSPPFKKRKSGGLIATLPTGYLVNPGLYKVFELAVRVVFIATKPIVAIILSILLP